jgi:hypothetical protein
MPNTVKLEDYLNSAQELEKLVNAAVPATPKYWIGRIATVARRANEIFAARRNELIMQYGEQVYLFSPTQEQADAGQKQDWVVFTDIAEVPQGVPTQWRVKAENIQVFTEEITLVGNAAHFDLPCERIKLADFEKSRIDFDLSKLDWMLSA